MPSCIHEQNGSYLDPCVCLQGQQGNHCRQVATSTQKTHQSRHYLATIDTHDDIFRAIFRQYIARLGEYAPRAVVVQPVTSSAPGGIFAATETNNSGNGGPRVPGTTRVYFMLIYTAKIWLGGALYPRDDHATALATQPGFTTQHSPIAASD